MTRLLPALPERMWPEHQCYFAFPMIEEDLELEDFDEWRPIETMIELLKQGRFDHTPAILASYDEDDHWVRRGAYIQIMGDAGTDAINERVFRELQGNLPLDYCLFFGEQLYYWGRLDVVPELVDAWRANFNFEDMMYIPQRLSMLLEEEQGPILNDFPMPERYPKPDPQREEDADAYHARVLARYAELVEQFGDKAFVFRGRLLDPVWVAQRGLADLAEDPKTFDPRMRQKFEAMTGIDCSPFYEREAIRPLAAAAIFEAFLADRNRQAFTPGKRYFFGHPIPAGDPEGAAQWPPR